MGRYSGRRHGRPRGRRRRVGLHDGDAAARLAGKRKRQAEIARGKRIAHIVQDRDGLAAALSAHRDKDTLEWSNEPLIELGEFVVPVDTPPWRSLKPWARRGGRIDGRSNTAPP